MDNEIISIEIGKLFNDLLEDGHQLEFYKDYERIMLDGECISIKTFGNKQVGLKCLSRHKTSKHLLKIAVSYACGKEKSVVVTTDHVCMVYNKDHFFENFDAKQLKVGQYVSIYDDMRQDECIGTIKSIEDLGTTDEYVYDCEVDDDMHAFYANDVLIHNSQFVNVKCVTDYFKKAYGLGDSICKWSDEDKLKLWKWMDEFVEKDVNGFVKSLITDKYKSEHAEVLRYSLEYMGDCGIYEAKKHYAVHKILSEGPEIVDKIKYSGIELKKATVPEKIKGILGEIYSGILTNNWTEKDFDDFIMQTYNSFKSLTVDDLAMWKGYSTAREASGFLTMEVGSTGIASACTYYNQLIEKLGLGKKYDQILLGQKVRFCYVEPDNQYGISYIAYHDGQWPVEFNEIFKVDYDVMFKKLVIQPLKGFFEATRFVEVDPRKQVAFDVFEL